MTIRLHLETPDLAVVSARGVLLRAEVDAIKRELHDHMQVHGKVHVLIRIEEDFSQLEAFVSWDDIDVDHDIQQHVVRMAVVGDLRWRDSAMLFFITAVSPFQIEYFKAGHEELARAWLVH
jgi:hypothetical protein